MSIQQSLFIFSSLIIAIWGALFLKKNFDLFAVVGYLFSTCYTINN